MKKYCTFLSAIVALSLVACKPSTDSSHQMVHSVSDTTSNKPAIPEYEKALHTVHLNKGEKWETNIDISEGIGSMRGLMRTVPAEPTLEDYRKLQKILRTKLQQVLEHETIKGEALVQFKNYVDPLTILIDKFGTDTPEDCKVTLQQISTELTRYSHFFFY